MKRTLGIGFLVVVFGLVGMQRGETHQKPAAKTGFPAVQAIFKSDCMPCHGSARPAGKYDLTSYASVMKPAEDGVMVVAGNPGKSLLLDYLSGKKKPAMPIGRPPLSAAKVKVITAWIKSGAKNK